VGFLVVPQRAEIVSPSAEALEQLAKRNKLVVESNPTPQAKGGLVGALFGLMANAAVRGAMGYLGQNVGKLWGDAPHRGELHAKSNY
jgi:hypothetical protein